jgi:hypothetical protein
MLTLPSRGQIEVQEREDVRTDDFARLTVTLDAHFAKHMGRPQ